MHVTNKPELKLELINYGKKCKEKHKLLIEMIKIHRGWTGFVNLIQAC